MYTAQLERTKMSLMIRQTHVKSIHLSINTAKTNKHRTENIDTNPTATQKKNYRHPIEVTLIELYMQDLLYCGKHLSTLKKWDRKLEKRTRERKGSHAPGAQCARG
mmetsp:Transcript_11078/g.18109  ORF Transcript_11078/g.18109 Transcript_11078/m.18109 type:complete len:106 (-) Transcript_11078:459-776(-)